MLTWTTCIATLNRHDVLMAALKCVLRQSRLPIEIVVVDASDDWKEGRSKAMDLLKGVPEIRLDYVTSPVRSSATQRNLAISRATGDIVVMIDDDSFLHEDCAERMMEIFDADANGEVAGVGACMTEDNPVRATAPGDAVPERKPTGKAAIGKLRRLAMSTHFGRWFNRAVLFQSASMLFIQYDEPRFRAVPEAVAHLNVKPSMFLPGCGMGYRRVLAHKEQFDTALRYYAAFEDLDVAYRLARHGALLQTEAARFHHFEAAAGRIKRQKVIAFQLLNMAIFLKRHARNPDQFLPVYRTMLWRRLLAEFLKDALSRRWAFPQVAGVLTAWRYWRDVWNGETREIDTWYPLLQKRILDDIG